MTFASLTPILAIMKTTTQDANDAHINFLATLGIDVDEPAPAPAATPQTFDAALANFVALVNEMRAAYYAEHYSNIECKPVTIDPRGRKYVRLVENGSVYCFVRKSDGAILKAATWKAPAKHARGSIYGENPLDGVNVYGANYMR